MQSKDALSFYSIYTGAECEMTVYLVKKVKFLVDALSQSDDAVPILYIYWSGCENDGTACRKV